MTNAGEPRVPIILDVDTGVDDALALGLAVRWPRVELMAVTTVAGNVDIDQATSNTLTILDWFGATDVPVHRGASRPLVRPLITATHYHGADGLGDANLPPSQRGIGPDRGPAAMIRLARSRPGELTIVCVGPLTNLAIALNVEPSLPDLLAGVVIMGGAYRVPGNITPEAEFNIYVDPEAAAQVFEAAPRFRHLTAVGLDVSHQTALTRTDWLASLAATDQAGGLLSRIAHRSFELRQQTAFFLHDPLALAVAVDPSLIVCDLANVEVALEGDSRGRTRPIGPGSVRIATTVDAPRFLRLFRSTMGLPAG
jgi:purine nucleosidase